MKTLIKINIAIYSIAALMLCSCVTLNHPNVDWSEVVRRSEMDRVAASERDLEGDDSIYITYGAVKAIYKFLKK